MKNKCPKSRKDKIVIQETDGEILIYDLNTDKAFCLNETSALIWAACNGDQSVPEITRSIGKKLNSPVNEDLVWLALDQLKKENLIEPDKEITLNLGGMPRREVIKKIGLASVIALPIITSLVAPHAAQAATCNPAIGTCTCSAPNGGMGNVCVPTVSTCGMGCVCRWTNNGNNTGTCAA